MRHRLDEPTRRALRLALTDYAEASVAEWALLAQRKVSPEVTRKADAVLGLLSGQATAKAVGAGVQGPSLARSELLFGALADAHLAHGTAQAGVSGMERALSPSAFSPHGLRQS